MTEGQTVQEVQPTLEELLPSPQARTRFEETSAALEAAALIRTFRRSALSVHGTRGISQTELANRAGLTPARISQLEKGDGSNGPTYSVIRRIAHACGVEWGPLIRRLALGLIGNVTADPEASVAQPVQDGTMWLGATVFTDFGVFAPALTGTVTDILYDRHGQPQLAVVPGRVVPRYFELAGLTFDPGLGGYVSRFHVAERAASLGVPKPLSEA